MDIGITKEKDMKIFISYSHQDKEKALQVFQQLKENNFEVLGDFNLRLGESFRNSLNSMLLQADVIVCLITPFYNKSNFANQELLTAHAYQMVRRVPQILPVLFEDAEMPYELHETLYLDAKNESFKNVLIKIVASLNVLRDEKENKQKTTEEEREVLQVSLSQYIKKTMYRLKKNERKNKKLSYFCYIGSGTFVIVAIIFSLFRANTVITMTEWQMAISKTISGALTLLLILALSRLLFVLGKSFMVESIRNSDRIHAISFGEFFLNAYGNIATRDEVREVFGNWNIDNGSSFITQSPKDYDPQLVENLISALNALKNVAIKD